MACTNPSILYPNGNEEIFDRTVTIQWHAPLPHDDSDNPVAYEIFFTDSYDESRQIEWVQIASIPAGATSFLWRIPRTVKSEACRVAIRCRDHMGFRGDLSTSATNFSIQDRQLSSPAVLSPVADTSYRFFVPFVLDHAGLAGTQSQRAFYDISYSSESQGIDWTTIFDDLAVGSAPFNWDARDLPPSDDYMFRIMLLDDRGNSSVPVFIRGITVSPLNFFTLDTIPPKGTIKAQGQSEFTNDRNVVLKLTVFDEATGVKSVSMQQREGDTVSTTGNSEEVANVKTWFLTGEDGVKFVEAVFKDAGNNVIDPSLGENFFRTLFSEDNDELGGVLVVPDGDDFDVWIAVGGSTPRLFRNQTSQATLSGDVSAMAFFESTVYFAIQTSSNTGTLQRYVGSAVETVSTLTDADSAITALAEFDDDLYVGLKNGELYKFTGSSMVLVDDLGSGISDLYSDGTLLYVSLDNSIDISIFDGISFTTAGVRDGYIQI